MGIKYNMLLAMFRNEMLSRPLITAKYRCFPNVFFSQLILHKVTEVFFLSTEIPKPNDPFSSTTATKKVPNTSSGIMLYEGFIRVHILHVHPDERLVIHFFFC